MNNVEELCTYYIAFLRAVYLVHQNHHWITRGKNFYGNHLMFERIYQSAAKDQDAVAEKLVGLFGVEVLDLDRQAEILKHILKDFSGEEPITTSLAIEKKFISLCEHFYEKMEHAGKMTLGLDDLILSVANSREEAVYLLQQALPEDTNHRMAARKTMLNRIADAPSSNPDQEETQAKEQLRQKISGTTIRLNNGVPVNFQLLLQRPGNDYNHYTLIVELSGADPSLKTKLQPLLIPLANQVPFLTNKIQDVSVIDKQITF